MSRKRRVIEADRLFNRPWFLTRGALKGLVDSHRAALAASLLDNPDDDEEDDDPNTPYPISSGGVACIDIGGVLTKNQYWNATSYSDLSDTVDHALENPAVRAILFRVDSPGGEVSGMFDLSDRIHGMRGQKPMAAISDDNCYSAAYCLASAADKVFVSRTGGVGSVGCWMAHVDYSQMLENQGIDVTYIFSGEKKIDGNSTQPLSDRARADMQAECDRIRGMFVDAVARNRGASADALYQTEAGIFMADAGIPLLADEVGTEDDALDWLREQLGDGEGNSMRSGRRSIGSAERTLRALYQSAVGEGRRWADHTSPRKESATLAVRCLPQMRAAAASGSSRKISMLVCPYDDLADLGGFKERYAKGCFSDGLDGDPRVLFGHTDTFVLGRQSAGTARFFEAPEGLRVEVDAPQTGWADDLLVSLRRKDIDQASAAFWILKESWEQRGSDRIRVIEKARLREASITAFAAYEATTATVSAAAQAHSDLQIARLKLLQSESPGSLSELERARLKLESLS